MELDELSVGGRALMGSLEARLFGKAQTTRLGRYHVLETLGRGAMGVVYKAYDPQLDRNVAVKVVTAGGEDARVRMMREAKALAKLNHPHVVTVHEVGEADGEMFVAMEYVDGGTLAQWCEAHSEPSRTRTRTLIEFAVQALEGLAAAHDLGLVHRDMKPANMLIGSDGRLRVADFGLARAFEIEAEVLTSREEDLEASASGPLTQTGGVVGTPAFMAPEQFGGVADAKSDQFGLCASFFLAFYGSPAYTATSVAELLGSLEGGKVAAAPSKHVPEFVRRVLVRGLRPRPGERFEDVRAVARALRSGARRRRWIAGGGMLSVGAAAIASVVWASQPAPCTDERARIEAAVEGESERVAKLVEASGRPHPGELSDRFSADLDQVVERWSDQRLEACRASRDQDPEVGRLGKQRLRCLDAAVDATARTLRGIESLTRAQADALPTLIRLVQGINDCDDADTEVFDTEQGQQLVALFRSGLAAEGRLDYSQARTAYEAVLEGSESGGFAHLRSETHTRLSEVCERMRRCAGVQAPSHRLSGRGGERWRCRADGAALACGCRHPSAG